MDQKKCVWLKSNIGSSLSWGITIGWLIFIYSKIHNGALPVNLNEFGDFVAGAFAPLAFFWLVRGFYQQGKGLEQNSKALKLQAIELKKTTEALNLQVREMKQALIQQTVLAETTKQDLDLSEKIFEYQTQIQNINSQPFFHFDFTTRTSNFSENNLAGFLIFIKEWKILNSRSTCREVDIYCDSDGEYLLITHINYLHDKSEETIKNFEVPLISRIYESDPDVKVLFNFTIKYLDHLDRDQRQNFELIGQRKSEVNKIDLSIRRV